MSPILKSIIFALVPKKRITSHILGVIIGAVAAFVGVSQTELKQDICKSEPVAIEQKEVK